MTPVQLVLLGAIAVLVLFVVWSWFHVGSKYPLRPKHEWMGHTCGECRFRATGAPHEGRCGDARSSFAGWYRDPDQPACETWQPIEEDNDVVETS